MSRYFKAEIQENRPVHAVHNLLTLNVPVSMPEPRPGQFFMIESSKGTDPLLKRAFSLFRKTEKGVRILYRIRGKGTEILKDMKEGSVLEVLGPLGTCYPLPSGDTIPLVIAGGIGIASVFSVRRVALVTDKWTVDNGLVTPTLKPKRARILERYADRVSELYRAHSA